MSVFFTPTPCPIFGEAFCIVTFDQRGAGQTRPSGFTEDNHTANLIEESCFFSRIEMLGARFLVGQSFAGVGGGVRS